MKKIGILGGGQLGMLLAKSIVGLGAEACIYDPDPDAPACHTVKDSTNAVWHDKKALSLFISSCDRVTYEFENVPYDALASLKQPLPIFPSLDVLKITQNRRHEKEFLRTNNLPHVPYVLADNLVQLKDNIDKLRFPVIVKTTTGGYDGKGQFFIKSKDDLNDANLSFPFPVIAEQAIDLYMEVSCITGRSAQKSEIVFPIFENVHRHHILDTTLMPARLPQKIAEAIQKLARQATEKLNVYGLLCTEFFIGRKKEKNDPAFSLDEFNIYINEFAPRPHNSGHVTMSGCTFSQFDILARILLDLPISQPQLAEPGYFCMANLLGDVWLAQGTDDGSKLNLADVAKHKELLALTIYGKKEARPGRKMGHLITHAQEADEALTSAISIREQMKKLSAIK